MLATFGDLDLALCAGFALAFAMALLFGSALAGGFLDLFDSVLAGASSPSCSGVKDAWDVDFQMFRLRSFFPLEVTFLVWSSWPFESWIPYPLSCSFQVSFPFSNSCAGLCASHSAGQV